MKTHFLFFLCAFSTLFTFAGEPTDIVTGHRFDMESKIMGEERTVIVYLPRSYQNGAQAYPVLYMTDGAGHVHHTGATVAFLASNQRMPEMIVVGVTNTNRTRDLTPGSGDARFANNSGGANRFLQFFTDELAPKIEDKYRTQPYKVFAGHSFGGLFAVNAFLENPDAFHAYIAVSPSLWWNNESMVKQAETFFSKHKKLERTLYLTLGDEGDRMEVPFNHFVEVLQKQKVKGFEWDSKIMLDEDHGSVVMRSHYFGLRKVFEDWIPRMENPTLDKTVAHYQALSERVGYKIMPSENMVNNLGYNVLFNDAKEAIRIFKWNVDQYPDSANVYDSLGEAQELAGMLKDAVKNYAEAYRRAKAINHANTSVYKGNMERVTQVLER